MKTCRYCNEPGPDNEICFCRGNFGLPTKHQCDEAIRQGVALPIHLFIAHYEPEKGQYIFDRMLSEVLDAHATEVAKKIDEAVAAALSKAGVPLKMNPRDYDTSEHVNVCQECENSFRGVTGPVVCKLCLVDIRAHADRRSL